MAAQTGSYDLSAAKAVNDNAEDAKKVAVNYITDINDNGIFVHEESATDLEPTDQNANGVHISGDVDIIRNGTSVARYGANSRIGMDGKSRIEIDQNSITGYNDDSVPYFDIDMSSGIKTETSRITQMFSNVSRIGILPTDGSLVQLGSTTFTLDDISTVVGTIVNVSEFQLGIDSGYDGTVDSTANCNAYIKSLQLYNIIQVEPNISSITIGTGLQRVAEAYIDLTSAYNYTLYVRIEFTYDASTNEITITAFAKDVNQSGNVMFGTARGYFTIENSVTTTAPVITLGTRDDTTPGAYSAAIGEHLITPYEDMVAVGKFNSDERIAWGADLLFAVGNGGADSSRSNAFAVDEYGRAYFDWSVTANGDIKTTTGLSLYNSYALASGDSISSGTNLNTLTTIGNYYCLQSATAATLTNCPVNTAFTLKVENGTGIDNTSGGNQAFYRSQTLISYDNPGITYTRRAYTSDGGSSWTWTSWKVNGIPTPIRNNTTGKAIPKTTYTELARITLPKNGKYIVLANGGHGSLTTSGTYFSLSTNVVSGSPTVSWNMSQQAPVNGGGQCSGVGYYETSSSDAVIQLRGYLYGNGATSTGGWGTLAAIRIA